MLPRLSFPANQLPIIKKFFQALRAANFTGEMDECVATRFINATDNSVYQILPQAVLFPKNSQDIRIIFQLSSQQLFRELNFTARGGGTGTNGQSLNEGIIIDCSKYLNKILELNLEENWVRVQPGVVLEQLNRYLKKHQIFFAPHLSPANRATLGGMASTDACGKGSRVYGKTSQHVLEVTVVCSDGSEHVSHSINLETLQQYKGENNLLGEVYRQVDATVCQCQQEIQKQFPRLQRFMTGYDLAHVYNDARDQFNLNSILIGSEGTLAVITELKLKLTPLPKYKKLFVLPYADFHSALLDAQLLVETNPHAIETIDHVVLELAKTDLMYPAIKHFLNEEKMQALNMIEFADNDLSKLQGRINNFQIQLKEKSSRALSHVLVENEKEIAQLWKLRESSVGLSGKAPGKRKPVSGIEDTVVAPEKLADYVQEFRALLDEAGLQYAMYGHVDVGCLHVRPALDLSDTNDEILYHELSDQIAVLVKKYNGLMWGEHGKGLRSQYMPMFFGTKLYNELRKIKKAFDPFNQLNPGKIAVPESLVQEVKPITWFKRGHFNKEIKDELVEQYPSSLMCNGNGACFTYNELDVMCPSYKATRDRRHSPKGRASLIRAWLYLQSQQEKYFSFTWRWLNSCLKKLGQYDFSHEVYTAMQGCLGCKACSKQCPVNVDIPIMKASFLASYHTRYLRGLRDYAIAYSERLAYQWQDWPRLANFIFQNTLAKKIVRIILKMQDVPLWASPNLKILCKKNNINFCALETLQKISSKEKAVVILQDWLTSNYEPQLVVDYYLLLKNLGYQVFLFEPLLNGKAFYNLGFLKSFKKIAQQTSAQLEKIAALQIPMIGIDPSITLTYRQEYPAVLGQINFYVYLLQEWLVTQDVSLRLENQTVNILGHCSEKTADALLVGYWQTILKKCAVNVNMMELGCCGMAGSYGYEVEHQAQSLYLYKAGWEQAVEQKNPCLITGFSCRSQVRRFQNKELQHPVSWLLSQSKGKK